ncbi:hypothetical protein NC651_024131 [Populus alba x Populus x berolinensis]|nr:hypothetical protein NC651_024131 [Populus alba x Populus x berolinensis]
MEPHLYRAAMDGKADLLRKMPDQFDIQATQPRIHSSTLHAVCTPLSLEVEARSYDSHLQAPLLYSWALHFGSRA